ncbi:MAG: hypothetical protein JWR85_3819 [Marmoricola sp.]|nr:hypothetical protein [Marmoricola sp.]
MRRRAKDLDLGDEPRHLRQYNPADWPNPECHPECAFWVARKEWSEEHPSDLDGAGNLNIVIDGPDVPWHPEWT